MKFAEAIRIVQAKAPAGARPLAVALACGCTAEQLKVFLTAHLKTLFPDRGATVAAGLYGDCLGNLERLRATRAEALAVLLEWPDLDPRLGLRAAGGWGPAELADIVATVEAQATRFEAALTRAAEAMPVALCLPTLPFPPAPLMPGWRLADCELQVRARVYALAAHAVRLPGVRLLNPQRLDQLSPPAERLDVRADLLSGFPYRPPHASTVAELLARLLQDAPPKKGLITDLDDTLWRGLLGEVGADGVSWSLDRHSHAHALYQQLLRSLAETGVLIAVASKNDPARVEEAFRRQDLLLPRDRVFPVEAHWGSKSESVGRILRAWNVGADSVVFVDDSPMELAEVKAAHLALETVFFPTGQDQAVYELLARLRDLFGKASVGAEDGIRLASLRGAAEQRQAAEAASADRDAFLRGTEAELTLSTDKRTTEPRALELVNKTNQFNLNGRHYTEGEWRDYRARPDTFVYRVSYRDRFGPLGTIAVLAGRRERGRICVDTWVLSCRAFSRRIEHRCVALLFEHLQAGEVAFDFQATPRNGPLQEFFAGLLGGPPAGCVCLPKATFVRSCPALYHQVKVVTHG